MNTLTPPKGVKLFRVESEEDQPDQSSWSIWASEKEPSRYVFSQKEVDSIGFPAIDGYSEIEDPSWDDFEMQEMERDKGTRELFQLMKEHLVINNCPVCNEVLSGEYSEYYEGYACYCPSCGLAGPAEANPIHAVMSFNNLFLHLKK